MTIRSNGAGHGGRKTGTNWMDPGAVGNGRREADVARTITQKMRAIASVRDTTDNNGTTVNQNLQNQVTAMNTAGSGVAITNHLNAFNGQATGVEVFYWAGNTSMQALAAQVSKAIADALGIPNRGAKPTTTFFVHRNTNSGVNVLLIEWCFIDNKSDMEKLDRHMDAAIRSVMNVLGYPSSGGNTNTGGGNNASDGLAKNPKPLTDGRVGDTVVVYDALYRDSQGAGRSTAMRGRQGKITRVVSTGKRYHIESCGWAHANDIQLISRANTATPTPQPTPAANVWHSRSGTVTVTAAAGINLRGTSSGDTTTPTNLGILALLGRGQQVKYDRVLVQRNGHAFVRQPRSGGFGWLAIGPTKDDKVTSYWVSGIEI
ncbi:N-acetylmuramoyl-L-alanine amidase [Enterococcus sp. AZ051]|uniref:N-acetylmuramoyl-L-alanine amidase n=1 Tax=Enterococcus sp. AZ051 TaxID=2774698 RepID=UPI003D2CB628